MEQITELAVCSGLGDSHHSVKFGVSQRELVESIQDNIPQWFDRCFGVFVTIHRVADKLPRWPNDIHGCVGNWNNDLQVMTPDRIIKVITEVSYQATHTDSRRQYFPPLSEDPGAEYTINFMLHPVLALDPTTGLDPDGSPFNNTTHGLIATSPDSRATYLPKVFPADTSWGNLRSTLTSKAGGTGNDTTFTFQSYPTKVYGKKISDTRCDPVHQLGGDTIQTLGATLQQRFVRFINQSYLQLSGLPYLVGRDGQVVVDDTQDVRNLATIADLLSPALKPHLDSKVKILIVDQLPTYYQKFTQDPELMRQASAFLLLALSYSQTNPSAQQRIITYLFQNLDRLEPRFEQGEVAIALKQVGLLTHREPRLSRLHRIQAEMYQYVNRPDFTLDDIFTYNWQAKYLLALCQRPQPQPSKEYRGHLTLLTQRMLELSERMLTNPETETNYLAVAWEGLASVFALLHKPTSQTKVSERLNQLFRSLMKRYRSDNGLFYFTDGQARIDITGHVLAGIHTLPEEFHLT
jgi:AMMECR1 domain-containing protein